MAGRPELLREEAALLVEHDALLLEQERLTVSGATRTERRAHAENLLRHRIRLRSFIVALQEWMDARRGL